MWLCSVALHEKQYHVSMDPVSEIKVRLPIEELVGQYCQLTKKGRNLKALCPFHNDKNPSLLVSPDKGIAYCFACQTGGDIFSFYQAIEGVEFPQALKDLAEKTGIELKQTSTGVIKKDEKDRMRQCLEAAACFYQEKLNASPKVLTYVKDRGVTGKEIEEFGLGLAPDSFSETYEYLLKQGFSRSEIVGAGLGIQKDLKEGKIYDYFRTRLMFPIHDVKGHLIGFGGRTLKKEESAKYINSPDGPLYRKSKALFSLHRAKEKMRTSKNVVVVEGYFDVLACWRLGITNTVAQCGTALTDEHVQLLKRSAETVILALDQDEAGREAAERAFEMFVREGVQVHAAKLPQKDPADVAKNDPKLLQKLLKDGGVPYLDLVLEELESGDVQSGSGKRFALKRLLPLLDALSTSVEREHYVAEAAKMLGVTEVALQEDMERSKKDSKPVRIGSGRFKESATTPSEGVSKRSPFSKVELALGLFFLYPKHKELLQELISPEDPFGSALYQLLKEEVDLPREYQERAGLLQLFCEEHGFGEWPESLALREIRQNCRHANREFLQAKQCEIAQELLQARTEGKKAKEKQLETQYQEVLKLSKMAG